MTACVICRGNKNIRLPVYKNAPVRFDGSAALNIIDDASRTYPCPECSPATGAEEKVEILYCTADFPREATDDVNYLEGIRSSLAGDLAREFLKRGIIETRIEARGEGHSVMLARIGAVSPKRVKTIEARATDKMRDFLNGVLEKAVDRIAVWGSYYSGSEGNISKGQAIDYVKSAWDEAIRAREHETDRPRHARR